MKTAMSKVRGGWTSAAANVVILCHLLISVVRLSAAAGMLSCSANSGRGTATWEALEAMESITYTVSQNPYTLSVIASGGAAGDGSFVVSEGQAYGVLTAALALASVEESSIYYNEAKRKFEGYFNGWKKMCQNSVGDNACQDPMYCNGGQWPCLPGWKHLGDLSSQAPGGSGAAPDGDVDAIVGMIIAVKAVEDHATLPSWHEEVREWADRSCSQFLQDNTELSPSGAHRLLKLGSCWGGWENEGNNPSYHAPAHFRIMMMFQESYVSRSYTPPSSLANKWNSLIDTTYKFLETTKCPNSGLVPNWALVTEVDSFALAKHPGSFSASATPQYEFGAEASRTMWRVAFDAAAFQVESAAQAGTFLAPLHNKLVENYGSTFGYNSLQDCSGSPGYVSNVFGDWQNNGFMFAPVYSTLVSQIPEEAFQGKSFTQQDMVDTACDIVSDLSSNPSYYSRSWQVIATMSLNGELARVGDLMRGTPTPPTPTPPSPTPPAGPTPTPPTPSPHASPCGQCGPFNSDNTPECNGQTETRCKQMIEYENKCHWTECQTPATPAPVPSPLETPEPTKFPVTIPTNNPTPEATEGVDECCTQDAFHCSLDSVCNEGMENCHGICGGTWTSKSAPLMLCISKWGTCTSAVGSCCDQMSCVGDDKYKQCL